MSKFGKVIYLMVALAGFQSCRCSTGETSSGTGVEATPEAKLILRGKAVYMSSCTACHNPNPKLNGSQGPDVFGSSKDLLTSRILYAKYPDGYKPKRESAVMPALPHLSGDIDAIHAYLNAP